jgi:predicted transcriptional regulator
MTDPLGQPATAPYRPGSLSSTLAAKNVQPKMKNQRTRIWRYLCDLLPDGATGKEIEDHFDWHRSSVSTRLGELETVGFVKRTGQLRPTEGSNFGEVYVAVPRAEDAVPMPPKKTTLRQAAKEVLKATDGRDREGFRVAITKLRMVLEGDHSGG